MLKVNVTIKCGAIPSKDPDAIRGVFSKKNMPKLYRYIEIATKQALKDKSSLPHVYGRQAFYDDDRQRTGKKGPHLISQYQTRTETGAEGVDLVVSNKKQVNGWNVFWMLNEGTRAYISYPKFMHFFDRYGSFSGKQPGFRNVQFRRGNERFVPIFNTWLEQRAQKGVDKGVEIWDMSGAAQLEFAKVLKRAGFNPEV
ncbi:hypothetical protein CCP3SC15_420019 [Gammaproteobacteria bacterium]